MGNLERTRLKIKRIGIQLSGKVPSGFSPQNKKKHPGHIKVQGENCSRLRKPKEKTTKCMPHPGLYPDQRGAVATFFE